MRLQISAVAVLCLIYCMGCGKAKTATAQDSPQAARTETTGVKFPSRLSEAQTPAKKQSTVAELRAGSSIPIELHEVVESDSVQPLFLIASVADDVMGADGGVVIPANATALLVVREAVRQAGHTRLTLALNRIQVGDKTLKSGDGAKDLAILRFDEDASLGPGHRSVHLVARALLTFRLEAALPLR